jgi:hypothetical protein
MLDREDIAGVTVRTEAFDGSSFYVNLFANGRVECLSGTNEDFKEEDDGVIEGVWRAITSEFLARLEKVELDPLPHETTAPICISLITSDGRVFTFWSGPEEVPPEIRDFCAVVIRATQDCRPGQRSEIRGGRR